MVWLSTWDTIYVRCQHVVQRSCNGFKVAHIAKLQPIADGAFHLIDGTRAIVSGSLLPVLVNVGEGVIFINFNRILVSTTLNIGLKSLLDSTATRSKSYCGAALYFGRGVFVKKVGPDGLLPTGSLDTGSIDGIRKIEPAVIGVGLIHSTGGWEISTTNCQPTGLVRLPVQA